ncbi:potassium/sodium eff [Suhomyces tanzawaensis NRRL Y-17324]|uniref:P-type Na(+) transporter n=1 Tax=Suhomyces tanzawaensis NRRL Y-17324 TaxID=984487 RepID=A0A1E4SJ01_9ASCO|nr:potassium/sodium eff [Suhomyces tanzawaensis NRRL Y-17324]ODV79485.1 potassium/sodium eff [Suhomyces tanzawaensis NRRL Y-17324]
MSETKKLKMTPLICTHSGSFHADESLAVYLIRLLPKYAKSELVRSRNPADWERSDIVIDVGGKYDGVKFFDHHQREFNSTFDLDHDTKLSSAGLIYKHFGKEIIQHVLDLKPEDPNVELLYLKIYNDFVESLDANDNGISNYSREVEANKKFKDRNITLPAIVSRLNPSWNKNPTDADFDAQFEKSSELMGSVFMDLLEGYGKSWLPARTIVEQSFASRFDVDKSGEILVLSEFCPWKEHLYSIEKENNAEGVTKFVLFKDSSSKWRVSTVSVNSTSFEFRKGLPEHLRGLRDQELSDKSGVPGCIFIHAAGFIGGAESEESVLQLARIFQFQWKIKSSKLAPGESNDDTYIDQSHEVQGSQEPPASSLSKLGLSSKDRDLFEKPPVSGLSKARISEAQGPLSYEPGLTEPWRLSPDAVAATLATSVESGLLDSQVQGRQSTHGLNNLGAEETISVTKILAHQIFNAMVLVLIISMVIALAIKDWISGGVIGFVVFINIAVGFVQEYRAEKTMGSLRSLSSPSARVLRNGSETSINAEEVVPGDIVFIRVGDTIPADLRLVDSMNLETDEALLTGESLPVVKNHLDIYKDEAPVPVGDRLNMVYSSSIVSKGRGCGIVVATGLNTEIGKIADSLKSSDDALIVRVDKSQNPVFKDYFFAACKSTWNIIMNVLGTNVGTPLQRRLAWLAIILFWVAVLFAIVVMGSQEMHVTKNVAIYAICVALSMIPSSLVVVLTITMAIGAQAMVQKHVIVRKLDSLEALGGINDICSDKTGTLTMGKMIAKKVWIPSVGTYVVADCNDPVNPTVGYMTFSDLSPQQIRISDEEIDYMPKLPDPRPSEFKRWLNTATLANIASVKEADGNWEAHGDATEIAINVFTSRLGYQREKFVEKESLEHLNEFPFDSSIKRMSAIYKDSNQTLVHTKGAVERLLTICNTWYIGGKLVELSQEDKQSIEENMIALSAEGLRVLAFAQREINVSKEDHTNREVVESNLTFLGLIGIYDPPRPESARSVKLCHKAGINVHMLTGDHPGTARAIAQEIGILPANLYHYSDEVVRVMVMTANEFDALSDEQIDRLPVLPLVIARCAPQTKVRMIDALHRRGKFVAMTGDGVNDSPSLKKADVGIAMGLNGSDVAKDASDIILTDDNFSSILNAIEEGRRMSSNIQKFVLQLLAENVAQALYLMVGLAFIDEDGFSVFPLAPVEVLWIIVVTSCFPAMGLGQEKANDDILDQPPNATIFTWEVIVDMTAYGFWMACCCLTCFVCIVFAVGDGELGSDCNASSSSECNLVFRGRAGAFAAFTWCALLLAWECIHMRSSFFNMRPESIVPWWKQLASDLWENQFLFWSILGGFLTVFPVIYIPVINDKVFLHAPIGYEWGLAVAFSVLFLIGAEAWKWIKRVYYRRQALRNPAHLEMENDPFLEYSTISKNNTAVFV